MSYYSLILRNCWEWVQAHKISEAAQADVSIVVCNCRNFSMFLFSSYYCWDWSYGFRTILSHF